MDGYLIELDEDECARLMKSQQVGRLAFVGPDGLTVHPVAYAWRDGSVWLRTAAGTALAGLPDGMPTAFEVDEIDADTSVGWSVLARGTLRRHHGDARLGMPAPWAPGERGMVLRIEVSLLSGRAVSAPD